MPEIYIDVDINTTLPVNILPLTDDTDYKTIENAVSASSVSLQWNFIKTSGSQTQIYVEAGADTYYKWLNIGNGMYALTVPATGGSYINNDSEGFGWFTGSAVGTLPWRSNIFGFRPSVLNNESINSASALSNTIWNNSVRTITSASGLSLASASSIVAIPTNPLLTTDSRLNNIDTPISTRLSGSYLSSLASASRVEAIQVDLDNPDQYKADISGIVSASTIWQYAVRTITSVSGLNLASASSVENITGTSASEIWSYAERYLTSGSNLNITGISASTIWEYTVRSLTDKGDFLLSETSASTIVDKVWDELLSAHASIGTAGSALADIHNEIGGISVSGASAQEVWEYQTRTITSVSGLNLASASSVDNITGTSASTIWNYGVRTITSVSGLDLASASRVEAIQIDLDNPDQYKADVSGTTSASTIWGYTTRTITSVSGLELASASSVENITGTSASEIWTYGDRKLTSVSGLVVEGSMPEDIWAYTRRTLTYSPNNLASITNGDALSLIRGDTCEYAFEDIDLTGYNSAYFTIKANYKDTDANSIIQVSSASGLLYLNGASGSTSGSSTGRLSLDQAASRVNIYIDAVVTKEVPFSTNNYYYDLQLVSTTGSVVTPYLGEITLLRDGHR